MCRRSASARPPTSPSNAVIAPLPRSSRQACSRSQTAPWATAAIGSTRGSAPGASGVKAVARSAPRARGVPRPECPHVTTRVCVDLLARSRRWSTAAATSSNVPGQPPPFCADPAVLDVPRCDTATRPGRPPGASSASDPSPSARTRRGEGRRTATAHRPSRASGGSRSDPWCPPYGTLGAGGTLCDTATTVRPGARGVDPAPRAERRRRDPCCRGGMRRGACPHGRTR